MPKERRSPYCRCGASPYSRYKSNNKRSTHKSPPQPIINETECEEARCPICMEHPHNAALLLCSSHQKGCRPYMCDTSSRHSNCLDQFRKSSKLVCPLCRGQVNGWTVVNPARQFMNSKTRTCSLGTCDFAGNYSELRKHARRVHPSVKPTDVDPERELEWRTLEDDIEQQDMLSMQFESGDDDDDDDDDDDYDYDDANEFMDLASPIWDTDYAIFMRSVESDLENVFTVFDSASDDSSLLDDWDDMYGFGSSHESQFIESNMSRDNVRSARSRTPTRIESNMSRENARTARSRTPTRIESNMSREHARTARSRTRENARTARSRTMTRVGHRSNGQPSSRNR
ncbi:uncharacterized protein LOC143540174 [Bidens hawaiensis]|uniref:uncharacterized protein LOC143540174 n=1 Tax=Bidens hawaiensis TaxID=980011 RepID=UPI0040490615